MGEKNSKILGKIGGNFIFESIPERVSEKKSKNSRCKSRELVKRKKGAVSTQMLVEAAPILMNYI